MILHDFPWMQDRADPHARERAFSRDLRKPTPRFVGYDVNRRHNVRRRFTLQTPARLSKRSRTCLATAIRRFWHDFAAL